MCSVSWCRESVGYELVFSRDEQRSRALAHPPARVGNTRPERLAPLDPTGGGTWITLNAHGLTVCVLNGRELPERPSASRPVVSRGRLPIALADAASVDDCAARLRDALALAEFRPVTVLAFDPSRQCGWAWDGRSLRELPLDLGAGFVSSSSFESERIVATRQEWYQKWRAGLGRSPSGDDLWRLHLDAGRSATAETVRMSRPDARTVSLTRVSVRGDRREMVYAPRDADQEFLSIQTQQVAPATPEVTV